MASLMDELFQVIEQENQYYQELTGLANEKTGIIVKGAIDELTELTVKEQDYVVVLKELEKKRDEILVDIANVLNQNKDEFTVAKLEEKLSGQPKEQGRLMELRSNLRSTIDKLNLLNKENQILLQQALEMVEFDLTLFKSFHQAPETANYDKRAQSTGELLTNSGFDAKQ